ncbi:MAG: glycosyltransferase family 1 protein [Ferruginibacter sp.]|nr:glycosyltransferase family 1 protein [Ferruginibacter sp.]
MKIAILGTRGIPNHYGGFEQFAEYLSVGLVQRGHEVFVYNSHKHPFQDKEFKEVKIIHCKDPEDKIGTAGQFIYDLNCILDSRKRNFDIILQLGYTSSSIWSRFLPKKSKIITNMDGLEWKRTKYSKKVQRFLKYAERLAVKYSDHLISDSVGIQDYLLNKYNIASTYIPYGAKIFDDPQEILLNQYSVSPYHYNLLIARLEPENSIEIILNGVVESDTELPFLVIGNHQTKYGDYLKTKFSNSDKIRFVGGVYQQENLNSLRYFSNIYFHGHTVGGTNPSLLEAMASSCLICANDNVFNRSILGNDAFYFTNESDVISALQNFKKTSFQTITESNLRKIENTYTWDIIINQYELLFEKNLSVEK